MTPRSLPVLFGLYVIGCILSGQGAEPSSATALVPAYEWRQDHDRDGIGKFYLGREIAQVMGHEGADWLERSEREEEERPSVLLEALKIRPGDVVADIGAGSGYFSWRMARLAGAQGRVMAVDVQPEMLELLSRNMAVRQVTNVVPVLGTITNANLPVRSIDIALLVDVYHEVSHPKEMIESLCQALRPGGRLVLVEYRAEDPNVPIKLLHKMTAAQVRNEMAMQPLDWVETLEVLPRQHIIIFRRRP
jgi:ubiquinone/menaquinone biosynthesis C-methylase UbiE